MQCDVVNFKMISHQDEDEVDGGDGRGGVEGKDENEWRGKTWTSHTTRLPLWLMWWNKVIS